MRIQYALARTVAALILVSNLESTIQWIAKLGYSQLLWRLITGEMKPAGQTPGERFWTVLSFVDLSLYTPVALTLAALMIARPARFRPLLIFFLLWTVIHEIVYHALEFDGYSSIAGWDIPYLTYYIGIALLPPALMGTAACFYGRAASVWNPVIGGRSGLRLISIVFLLAMFFRQPLIWNGILNGFSFDFSRYSRYDWWSLAGSIGLCFGLLGLVARWPPWISLGAPILIAAGSLASNLDLNPTNTPRSIGGRVAEIAGPLFLAVIWTLWRRWEPLDFCRKCGYSLKEIPSENCPECGQVRVRTG